MGLQPVKTVYSGGVPVWKNVIETAQGGFKLDITNLTAGDTLKAGSVISYNEATRIATVLKGATMQASATNTDTTYNILKGSGLKVGDKVASVVGGKSYAITAIDASNTGYDAITVGTTLAVALVAGDVLFQSSGSGASAGALNATPKGLLYEDTFLETGADVAVVTRGTVFERRIPGVSAAIKSTLPNLIFSQSF